MRIWNFEGTTQEFSEVASRLGFNEKPNDKTPMAVPETTDVKQDNDDGADGRFVTVDEAIEVLDRLSLSENMQCILRLLYKNGEKRLLTTDLRAATGLTANAFRGLMGAFGRRLSNTVPPNVRFWDDRWDGNAYQKSWTLPNTVREALERLKIV